MTFIPAAVCSSYCGCEKTFVIPKPRVNFIPRSGRALLYRKRVKGHEGRWKRNPFTRLKFWILDDDACSNGMEQHEAVLPVSQDSFLMQVNGYLMSHSVENFDLSVYLLRGG